jgi:RNA polymerase sigma factor (sigma-70 family)
MKYWELGVEFALGLARKWTRTRTGLREDAEQAALTGLWVAALRYDPERGAQFNSVAFNDVRYEIRGAVWGASPWGAKASRSLNRSKSDTGTKAPPVQPLEVYWEELARPDNSWLDDREYVAHLLSWLSSDRLRTVARRRWLEGLTCVTIAHQMGLQPQTVRLMCSQAFKEMKAVVEREGLT